MKSIFAVIHHKRSLLFEEGLKLILKDFPVIVQNTGIDKGFGEFGIKHPNLQFVSYNDHVNYDTGLVRFKDILQMFDWDIVHFLDNDLFIQDTTYIKKTLEDFAKSDYGFASHLENTDSEMIKNYTFKNTLAEVTDQKFDTEFKYFPHFKPVPNWENCAMMFKRSAWDSLSENDLSHGHFCIRGLYDKGVKMATKKIEPRLQYTHAGDGFIHIGNLFSYYYRLEQMDSFDENSKIDLSRLGYFIYQKKRFKVNYAPEIEKNLSVILQGIDEQKALDAWLELTKGYCHKAEDKVMPYE